MARVPLALGPVGPRSLPRWTVPVLVTAVFVELPRAVVRPLALGSGNVVLDRQQALGDPHLVIEQQAAEIAHPVQNERQLRRQPTLLLELVDQRRGGALFITASAFWQLDDLARLLCGELFAPPLRAYGDGET